MASVDRLNTIYCPVNTKVAKLGHSQLLLVTMEFGPRFAIKESVGAGRLAASTCEAENQGNSGFARRGGLKPMGLPYRPALDIWLPPLKTSVDAGFSLLHLHGARATCAAAARLL
ncbi:MAG: hypothetical protein ACXVZX_13360 [Terriglobales bacterium]